MKVHSVMGLVTNSSTTIITRPLNTAPETLKAFIDKVLVAAGSDKKCDDLFKIEVEKTPDIERLIDYNWNLNVWSDDSWATREKEAMALYSAGKLEVHDDMFLPTLVINGPIEMFNPLIDLYESHEEYN